MSLPAPLFMDWLASRPFTLGMSSGFFGFFAHFGVVKALHENGITPARFTGSSAGALVGACVAAGCPLDRLEARLLSLTKQDFWDPSPGMGLLRGAHFRAMLASLLPISDLSQAPTPVAVSAWHGRTRRTRVLRSGAAVEAIYASCAVPGLFQPASIDGQRYWDGGIADRHGLASSWPGERVLYHHLQSRSPWRSRQSAALEPPQRTNLVTLTIDGLPRSGPNRLEQGYQALEHAYLATQQALAQPVTVGRVHVFANDKLGAGCQMPDA
ncbi:patatin-like phospholipase family protein [Alcanivorax sp.]|uniref:patatin-like phospholipase family protein n=1 Tax=Alcanivorax sp. TaxID=1872427 RepID=UPI0025C56A55|nr:patatin-like phospholipase family protein [Alcanivorax sp.]